LRASLAFTYDVTRDCEHTDMHAVEPRIRALLAAASAPDATPGCALPSLCRTDFPLALAAGCSPGAKAALPIRSARPKVA
jgi:hypothetical protein